MQIMNTTLTSQLLIKIMDHIKIQLLQNHILKIKVIQLKHIIQLMFI